MADTRKMTTTKRNPTINLSDIVEDAQLAFWAEVVKHLPLAEGGDFDPMSSHHFDLAVETAIVTWWEWNASQHYDLRASDGEILAGERFHCYDCGLDYSSDEAITSHTCGIAIAKGGQ
jgi:hypothetical protein